MNSAVMNYHTGVPRGQVPSSSTYKDTAVSPRVTLIIPTYNRRALLEKCLQSVKKQDFTGRRIIVVDDGSTDGTYEFLSKCCPKITVIRNERSHGPAFARNQGINATRSEFVYFLDSDTQLFYTDTISQMVTIMDERPDVAMLGGIGQPGTDNTLQSVYGKKVTFDGRSFPVFIHQDDPDFTQHKIAECDYVETCNCFVRTEAIRRIGGFNSYYVYMGEDKEIGVKLRGLNYKCCFGLHIACLHTFDHTARFDRPYTYLRGKMHYAIRNHGIRYLFIIPLLDLYLFFFHYPFIFLLRRFNASLRSHYTARNTVSPNAKPPRVRWLIFAPYYFIRAYLANIRLLPLIIKHRSTDFLLPVHMDEYQQYCGTFRHD